jgi:POT family proton-dependent oligopeptide transporter
MVLGLVQYALGGKRLGRAGLLKTSDPPATLARRGRNFYLASAAIAAALAVYGLLIFSGALTVEIGQLAHALGYAILVLSGAYFLYLFFSPGLTGLEKKRIAAIVWLFLLSAVFWSGFEQAGSSMNVFARDLTNRSLGGWEMPASWLQNVNPTFIIVLAPAFGWLWIWLARRKANPSTPAKFALALLGVAGGFFVLSWGAANATEASRVSMVWLVVAYFFNTVGELCLSPVGLSSVTKLAPRGRVGEMMGVWFISIALGDLIAGLVAGHMGELSPSALFRDVALFMGATGVVALLFSPLVKRLEAGAD